jgi:hypothetical protein
MAPNGVVSVERRGTSQQRMDTDNNFRQEAQLERKSEPPTYELGVEVIVRASVLLPTF